MSGPFDITAAANFARLNDKRQAEASFTVFNNSGRPIRGRAVIVLADNVPDKWIALEGEAERDFPIAVTQQYAVKIAVPPDATQGNYQFRLDEEATENANGGVSQGPTITFEVPPPVPPDHKLFPFPTWVIFVIAGVLLLVVAIVVVILVTR